MTLRWIVAAVIGALSLASGPARAAEVKVLAAAATEVGVRPLLALYQQQTGDTARVEFATGPEIQARVMAGEAADLVIGPEAVITALRQSGRLLGEPVRVGAAGIWMGVRHGARRPAIATLDQLKGALASADGVVFSRAATGVYMEGLVRRLGLEAQIAPRVVRPQNGQALIERLASGKGDEIGFTASTELSPAQGRGVDMVAPLPAEVQNYTTAFAATEPAAAGRPEVARLIGLLGSPEGRALLHDHGLD